MGILMGITCICAPHVANLFLFCYKRYFMLSVSAENLAYVIEAFIMISKYMYFWRAPVA